MGSLMNRWKIPTGQYVFLPASLSGLPPYKADACRLFMAGRSEIIMRVLS